MSVLFLDLNNINTTENDRMGVNRITLLYD